MSSSRSQSSQNLDSGFVQPGATTAPKSDFIPRPLRARKRPGRDYDPSLTAGMGPPDADMAIGDPNTDFKRQHPTTEEENVFAALLDADKPHEGLSLDQRLRRDNRRAFREHIQNICALFKPTDRMSDLDAAALAAAWENRLWNISFGDSDRISAYTKSNHEADQDFTNWMTYPDSTEGDGEGKRTGRQLFADHIQKFHANELQYTTRTGSLNEISASAVPTLVSSEDKHRQTLRKVLADELKTMKALLPAYHALSNFDIAEVVHKWEHKNWIAACEQGFNVRDHITFTEEECGELHLWAEYRDDYPDEDIGMTGEARFSEFIRRHLEPEISATSTQHGDGPATPSSADDSYSDSDIGSEYKYEDEEEGYARKKAYLMDSVAEYLPHYAENPDDVIDQWHEKLLLQARWKGGGFKKYKESLDDDLDTVEACRDSWDLVVPGDEKTGHTLFTELMEECSEDAVYMLRKRVEQKEEKRRHERLLNSEEFIGSLGVKDQKRREHRSTLRISINNAKEAMEGSHELSDVQATELAACWETQVWTDEPGFHTYLSKMDDFEMDLMEWTQSWHSALDNGKTGEQNFLEYIHQNPDRSVLRCELHRVFDRISSTLPSNDPLAGFFTRTVAKIREGDIWILADESLAEQVRLVQGECRELNWWYTQWTNVCDQGLTGEEKFHRYYDQHFEMKYLPDRSPEHHGLDAQTADELFDLAGGNDTASNYSDDIARSNGMSDEFLESNDQELVSPRSPKTYDSSDDENLDEPVESDIQRQSDNQSATISVPLGSLSAPSSDTQAAEPIQADDSAQKQPVGTFHEMLTSSNQPQVGNNASTSGVTAARGIYLQVQPTIPIIDHKTAHLGEDTAMAGLAYHPLSEEVEMLDGDLNLPAQKEAVDGTPTGEFAADTAISMKDTEMSGGDVPEMLDDNSKPIEPFTTSATGNASSFLIPYAGPGQFWSTPQAFSQPASISKNESTPSGPMFNLEGLSFRGQTTAAGITSFNVATHEPDVPQITMQASMSRLQAVEEQPSELLTSPTEVVSNIFVANVPEEDGKVDLAGMPEVAETKTILAVPALVAAPQLESSFTFKPPKGGFVPILPSGFDAGNWSGGFDLNPTVDDGADKAASSSDEVGSIMKATEVQEPEVDEPADGVGADHSHDAISSSPAGIDGDTMNVLENKNQESPVAENRSFDNGNALDTMNTYLTKITRLFSQCAKIDAMNAEADEREQANALQLSDEDAKGEFEEESDDQSEDCSDRIKELCFAVQACDAY